ncbi:MAG: hypothetical protein ABEJ90_01265 [Halobacterium sp.]
MNSDAGGDATDAGESAGATDADGGPTDSGGDSDADLTDGGYVHRPSESVDPDPPTEQSGFGRKGWLLVAAVVFSTLLVPGLIYLRPAGPARLGFGFRAAMLVLPLLPAVLLGFVAVWSMTAAE